MTRIAKALPNSRVEPTGLGCVADGDRYCAGGSRARR